MMVLDLPFKKILHLCCYQSFTMKKDLYKYSRAYSLPVFEPVFKKILCLIKSMFFRFRRSIFEVFLGFTRNGMEFFACQKHHFDQVGPFFTAFLDPSSPWFLGKTRFWGHGLKRMQVPKKLELVLGWCFAKTSNSQGNWKMMNFLQPLPVIWLGFLLGMREWSNTKWVR